MEDSTFEKVRHLVSQDLKAVKPLRPAWMTAALVTVPAALIILGAVMLWYGLRDDASRLGVWSLWGPPGMTVVVAYVILYLALAQRAPESTVSSARWMGLLAVAVVIQVGGAYMTLLSTGGAGMAVPWWRQAMCFARISALSIPALVAALWLLSRGLPFRPRMAGLLSGLGGGFIAEGIYRLQCGLSQPEHILLWHTGAVLLLAAVGFLLGIWWETARFERWLGGSPGGLE